MLLQHRRKRDKHPAVNAGSMADIAFLLLIFFLVTTKIAEEKVLKVKLPPWSELDVVGQTDKAIFNIKLNAKGDLLVEKEPAIQEELKTLVKSFIRKPTTEKGVVQQAGTGIISLQHETSTKYGKYIAVYDILQSAYAETHQAESMKRFGVDWVDLEAAERNEILLEFPLKISEAEPFVQ